MKKSFDLSAAKGVVEVIDQQTSSFYNQEPSALTVGTTVIVPAQKAHIRMRTFNGKETPTKALFAYVLDKNGELIENKEISLSQFQRRSYGIGDIKVKAIVNEKGLIRGVVKPNESNIIGKKPDFKVVNENGKNILVLAESIAFNVSRGQIHNLVQFEEQRADGLYDFKTKMFGDIKVLDLDTRFLPNLETVPVPTGYETLTASCTAYLLK